MKIAIVAPEMLPVPPVRGGGIETIIDEVAARLDDHEVHVFSIGDPALAHHRAHDHRTFHHYTPGPVDRLLLSSWKLPFKQSRSPLYYWPYARWAAGRIARIHPDVVWVHCRLHFVPAIRRAAPRAKILLSVHNVSNFQPLAVWRDPAIAAVDGFTGCSRYLTEALAGTHQACGPKAHILYNGANVERIRPWWTQAAHREQLRRQHGLTGPVILFAGRLIEEKGPQVLLEAYAELLKAVPNAVLRLVGSHTYSDPSRTPFIESLHRRAREIGGHIRFAGFVSPQQLPEYLLVSDVLAFPSMWEEPFGLTIVEAMAAGLPVVAFERGGPREILTHRTDGWLVPFDEGAHGFAEALRVLSQDVGLRRTMGEAARRTAETRFSWEAVTKNFLALCRNNLVTSSEVTSSELTRNSQLDNSFTDHS